MKEIKGLGSGLDIESNVRSKIDFQVSDVRNQAVINAISRNMDERGSGLK